MQAVSCCPLYTVDQQGDATSPYGWDIVGYRWEWPAMRAGEHNKNGRWSRMANPQSLFSVIEATLVEAANWHFCSVLPLLSASLQGRQSLHFMGSMG